MGKTFYIHCIKRNIIQNIYIYIYGIVFLFLKFLVEDQSKMSSSCLRDIGKSSVVMENVTADRMVSDNCYKVLTDEIPYETFRHLQSQLR